MNEADKLREIHQQYANDVAAAKDGQVLHAAYLNLTNENANAAEEIVRQTILKFGETGMLDVAAKYISDAQKVNSVYKKK